jgi:AmmeMemoRadiSam system protein B
MRQAGVRGTFYPQSCEEIDRFIDGFNNLLENAEIKDKSVFDIVPRAIIAPHAGYIYSGFTANIAYKILQNAKAKRVVVIGPSHRVYLDGVSGSFEDTYETPCGEIEIDQDYLDELKENFGLIFNKQAHSQEHSTETQMPFVKKYLPETKVIELIYGKVDDREIAKIVEYVLDDPGNVVVISTDLSHFYDLKKANALDNICLNAIANLDLATFDKGCEACGLRGVKAVIRVAKKKNLRSKLLDYRTSADRTGDKSRVVGYVSGVIY